MTTAVLPAAPTAARWFHALSDETRLQVVEMLSHGERCVCELQNMLDTAQSRLSFSSNLYDAAETAGLPEGAVLASLGCGNPTALAELREGETVLDLGSGGGIDVLLSARRVGPTGKAYGLDMTDE